MKIAIATTDGTALSHHFGRSAGFVVFGTDGDQVLTRELRTNDRTPHAQGLCDHSGQAHGSHGHSHTGVIGLLKDCEVVVCGGMGAGAAVALQQQGIKPVVLTGACSVEEALSRFLKGTEPTDLSFCDCGH